jgi:hypothetical protein
MFSKLEVWTVALAISALTTNFSTIRPALAQAGEDQAIFQEEKQLLRTDQMQEQQLIQQKQTYEAEISKDQPQDDSYRSYAEKRVQELTKLKAAGGSPTRSLSAQKNGELYALDKWLAADAQARSQEQVHLEQLDKAIANLQEAQVNTTQNMNADVQGLHQDATQAEQSQKFNQQMQINNFNELQSEMGAASWGRPPTDGTYNSVGGYGMNGGYGYSPFMGRRFGGYR